MAVLRMYDAGGKLLNVIKSKRECERVFQLIVV